MTPELRVAARSARLLAHASAVVLRFEAARATGGDGAELRARTKRALGRALLDDLGFEVQVHGSIPRHAAPRLVVANHRSAFDIPLMLSRVPDAVMLSRADLATWPLIGRLAALGDTLFVDRGDRSDGARAIRSMRSVLAGGRTLVVFPEGTTHAEPSVRPFHGGAFAAARGLPVELVPVGIAYRRGLEFVQPSMGAHVRAALAQPRLAVAAVVGAPRPLPAGRADAIARAAHEAVSALAATAEGLVR